jgi:TonB-dependent starch-binding outer membrane protein SusC
MKKVIYNFTKLLMTYACLFLYCHTASAQIKFSGTILDEQNVPLKGATILVKGKSNSTSSDAKGKFNITVEEGAVLIFSYIGFNVKEVPVSNNMIVILQPAISKLNDVVVVGYGTKKRKDISTSIATISGDDIRKSPTTSIESALQGRAAGVQVISNDGNPGGNISVKIRGASTASPNGSNEPLYVVDGSIAPNGISFLNPSDIESIDVLKDAAATSIYGIQGANGVVLLKTRKGGKNGKMNLFFDAYGGVQQIGKKLKMLDAQGAARMNNRLIDENNNDPINILDPGFIPSTKNPFWDTEAKINAINNPGSDWQNEAFQNAKLYDATLTMTGGTEKTSYSFSVGRRDEDGIIVGSNFKRNTLRLNVEQQTTNWLTLGFNVNYGNTRQVATASVNDENDGFMQAMLFTSPSVSVRDASGRGYGGPPVFPGTVTEQEIFAWYGSAFNPISILESRNPLSLATNLYGNGFVDIKLPLKGLSFRANLGIGRYNGTFKSFSKKREGLIFRNDNNSLFQGDYDSKNINFDQYLNYYKWIKGHSIEVVAGHTSQDRDNDGNQFSQLSFDNQDPRYQYIGYGSPATLNVGSTKTKLTFEAYFTRFNYSYKEKYYIQGSYRRDGASNVFQDPTNFGNGKSKFADFYAGSVKWRISKEKFFSKIKFINDFSVRYSYGDAGTTGGAPYPGYSLLGASATLGSYPITNNSGVSQAGVFTGSYGNSLLGWERNRQSDFGIDLVLFKNRLSITADWYNRLTIGMISNSKISPIFGLATPPYVNLAGTNLKNSGFEIAATWSKTKGKFKYNISGNFSTNKNEILDLGDNKFLIPNNNNVGRLWPISRTSVGTPIGAFYGYTCIGVFQSQKEIDASPTDEISGGAKRPGDLKFKDINGDGKINADDQGYIGQPIPKYGYGVNFQASYGSFDASIFFQGVGGNKIYSWLYAQATIGDAAGNGLGANRLEETNNWWSASNPTSLNPRIVVGDPAKNGRNSSFWLQDGDYLRFKTVQIGYTLPNFISKKMQLQRMRVYISANNLLTFTKYKGYDPEVGVNVNTTSASENRDLQSGVDRGKYPQPRTMIFGINVTF